MNTYSVTLSVGIFCFFFFLSEGGYGLSIIKKNKIYLYKETFISQLFAILNMN